MPDPKFRYKNFTKNKNASNGNEKQKTNERPFARLIQLVLSARVDKELLILPNYVRHLAEVLAKIEKVPKFNSKIVNHQQL